jgi:hypothetical protein
MPQPTTSAAHHRVLVSTLTTATIHTLTAHNICHNCRELHTLLDLISPNLTGLPMTNPPNDVHGFCCCTTLTDSTFNLCRFGNTLEVPQGAGSGFMWDTEGHVVTNFHVRMWVGSPVTGI